MSSNSFSTSNKVVGIFHNHSVVNSVLTDLNNRGFGKDNISVLARDVTENSRSAPTYSNVPYGDLSDVKLNNDFSTTSIGIAEEINKGWGPNPNNFTAAEKTAYEKERIESNTTDSSYDDRHEVTEKIPM